MISSFAVKSIVLASTICGNFLTPFSVVADSLEQPYHDHRHAVVLPSGKRSQMLRGRKEIHRTKLSTDHSKSDVTSSKESSENHHLSSYHNHDDGSTTMMMTMTDPRSSISEHHQRALFSTEVDKIINNGVVELGIRPTGRLIVPATVLDDGTVTSYVGLRYKLAGENEESEALAFGDMWETWGVSADNDVAFDVPATFGDGGIRFDSFTTNENDSGAVSVVSTQGGKLKVTHDFQPSSDTSNLYEVTVSMENTSGDVVDDLRYRRALNFEFSNTVSDTCHIDEYLRFVVVLSLFSLAFKRKKKLNN